jgi:deferrochelatase/peroxidase EfeB
MQDKDDFGYHTSDHEGLKCPVGSHIRRTNPRDTLDADQKTSVRVVNKHRILRRGRSYGKPVCESLAPEDILKVKDVEGERGLHFICFNSDISRQFEFVQNAWVNNPKFANFYDERDPIIGNHDNPGENHQLGIFSIPQSGLRKRYHNIPEFVTTVGGAYFFLPGIKALKYLSSI